VQKCLDRVAKIKKNKIRKCNKKHEAGSEALDTCLADVDAWEKRKLKTCVPCEEKWTAMYDKKIEDKCDKIPDSKPAKQERCLEKWEKWL
jgi:hypothetical protein